MDHEKYEIPKYIVFEIQSPSFLCFPPKMFMNRSIAVYICLQNTQVQNIYKYLLNHIFNLTRKKMLMYQRLMPSILPSRFQREGS
jgi:hypothetical protein